VKKFAEVESTRRAYHATPDRNSVHRSATTFPIKQTSLYRTNVTFLNHWKIKRGILEVGARHTLRDEGGRRLGQVCFVLDKSKAYSFDLEEVGSAAGVEVLPGEGTWEVEFFSARNLFIPYPAVIMNTFNRSFFNQVHAYARTLSDAEEDAQVNQIQVRESCIDVIIDDETDTFVELINGPTQTDSHVLFTIVDQKGRVIERTVPFVTGPHAKRTYLLSKVFGADLPATRLDRTLFIHQPRMEMFFSRVWGGTIRRVDGAFSANHSYYDNGATEEYWTITPTVMAHSSKNFPLFEALDLVLRLYPIMSPCDLVFHVALYDGRGRCLKTVREVAAVQAGSARIIEIDLGVLGRETGARSAEVFVTPRDGDKVPMRIAFQVCYGSGRGLTSSINISLLSPYVFAPGGKTGKSWFEVVGHPDIENRVGLYHTAPLPDEEDREVKAVLYRTADESTLTATLRLHGKQAWSGELDALFPGYQEFLGGQNGFLYAESGSQFLRGLTIQTHRKTGHTSGEHSF